MKRAGFDDYPDCGEQVVFRRGVVPLTATAYCPACQWCDELDGKRGTDAKEDWARAWVRNTDIEEDDEDLEIKIERLNRGHYWNPPDEI